MRVKGYRTLAVNIMLGLLPAWEVFLVIANDPEFVNLVPSILPAEWLPLYTMGIALVNIYMRTITTTPVGKS